MEDKTTHFTILSQRHGNPLSLFFPKDNTTILIIHGQTAIEVTDILVEHLQWLGESTPCTTSVCVSVTDCMDVWASFVDLGMD